MFKGSCETTILTTINDKSILFYAGKCKHLNLNQEWKSDKVRGPLKTGSDVAAWSSLGVEHSESLS